MNTVKDVLDAKGHEVCSVKPDDTVFDAVKQMADRGIGSLLVMNGDNLVGIMTERDYARKIILKEKSSKTSPVSDVMTTRVLVAKPEHTIDECLALMTDERARHLPVMDRNTVVGIVSIGDLVKAVISEQQILIEQLQHYISG